MKYLIVILCLFSNILWAQDVATLEKNVSNISASNAMQNKMIAELQSIYEGLSAKIDTALNIADINTANIEIISDTLHLKVLNVHSTAHEKIDAINDIVSQNKTFWIIGSIVFLLALGLIFFLLNNQIKMMASIAETNRTNTENSLRQANARLHEQLDDTNKDLNNAKMALSSTQKDLDSAKSSITDCDKQLNDLHKALESSHNNLDATNKKLDALAAHLAEVEKRIKS